MNAKEWLKNKGIKNTFIQVSDRTTQDLNLLMEDYAYEMTDKLLNRYIDLMAKYEPKKLKERLDILKNL